MLVKSITPFSHRSILLGDRYTLKINLDELKSIVKKLDGKGYKHYKRLLELSIDYRGVIFYFTKIQADPYAPPSIIEAKIPYKLHGINTSRYKDYELVAIEDYLYRKLYKLLIKYRTKCGTGRSCYLGIPQPSNIIIKRSAIEFIDSTLIVRFYVGLPSIGRRINCGEALKLLVERIPRILSSLSSMKNDLEWIEQWVKRIDDYYHLKKYLVENNIVAFIGENSILPRESSLSHKPLKNAKPFKPPEELMVTLKLPSGKVLKGMIIPRGLIVITGAGYHGKTTLLEALQEAIYPHIPGDGREYVVSRDKTVMVKAEDGRLVHNVDISAFIHDLPSHIDIHGFTTLDASGSTSMASSISEFVESNVETILIDEDTSATNLLYKDRLMSRILVKDTITTLSELIDDFKEKTGINIVIVSSASSVFLSKADTIILMEEYTPKIISVDRDVIEKYYSAPPRKYRLPRRRIFQEIKDLVKIKSREWKIVFKYRKGKTYELDLRDNPRIIEKSQVKMIALIIEWIQRNKIHASPRELAEKIDKKFQHQGFKAFTRGKIPPDLAEVRGLDVIWVLNRTYNAVFRQE